MNREAAGRDGTSEKYPQLTPPYPGLAQASTPDLKKQQQDRVITVPSRRPCNGLTEIAIKAYKRLHTAGPFNFYISIFDNQNFYL